jgi:hypothetical protein
LALPVSFYFSSEFPCFSLSDVDAGVWRCVISAERYWPPKDLRANMAALAAASRESFNLCSVSSLIDSPFFLGLMVTRGFLSLDFLFCFSSLFLYACTID